jgi:hypothetical protein
MLLCEAYTVIISSLKALHHAPAHLVAPRRPSTVARPVQPSLLITTGVLRLRRGPLAVHNKQKKKNMSMAAELWNKNPRKNLDRLVELGLGRIVALHCRSSTLYQIHLHIRCLYC